MLTPENSKTQRTTLYSLLILNLWNKVSYLLRRSPKIMLIRELSTTVGTLSNRSSSCLVLLRECRISIRKECPLQTGKSFFNTTNAGSTTTKPLKLTTWRPSNAYKEIPVPLPPGVRQGQSWRLIITGSVQSHGRSRLDTIDLGSEEIGKLVPFAVMSMPVLFSTTGTKVVSSKQEKIERMYSVRLSGSTGMRGIDSENGSVALLRFTEQNFV